MSKPQYELAQVIEDYGEEFNAKHAPLKQHVSVLDAIQKCRTAALGGHVDVCDSCAHVRISYNSCSVWVHPPEQPFHKLVLKHFAHRF